jgi:hypothetical protein
LPLGVSWSLSDSNSIVLLASFLAISASTCWANAAAATGAGLAAGLDEAIGVAVGVGAAATAVAVGEGAGLALAKGNGELAGDGVASASGGGAEGAGSGGTTTLLRAAVCAAGSSLLAVAGPIHHAANAHSNANAAIPPAKTPFSFILHPYLLWADFRRATRAAHRGGVTG